MSTRTAPAGIFSRRMLAVAAVTAIVLSLALTLGVALANGLHQFEDEQNLNGISWDAPGFEDEEECAKLDLAPGEVFWHFIQNQVADGTESGKLTAEFDLAGTFTDVVSYKKAGGALHWSITTGHDTLLSASTNVTSPGQFNLSHICVGPEESVAESAEESVAESAEESVAESAEESVAGSEAESVAESVEESVAESEAESIAESVEESVAESEAESIAESAEQSVEGSVAESEAESAEQSVEGSVAESEAESAEQSVEGSAAESAEQSVAESEAASGEQSVKAGEGTPAGSVSDGAFLGAATAALPTILFSLILLGSLGTLAYANVKAVRNRN